MGQLILSSWAAAFIVSFVYIFLKALQQLQVVHHETAKVIPVSLCMALCEVTVVTLVIKTSFFIFIPIGLGGGVGCIIAMNYHKKRREKSV